MLELLILAKELIEIPAQRGDEDALKELFTLVRSDLQFDSNNIKNEQTKFWRRHPALVKVMFFVISALAWQG